MTENNTTNADRQGGGLLEEIVSAGNLNRAYKRVEKNKGAGGVDGMRVEELLQYLKDNGDEIRESIQAGAYEPQPVRRVEIPKDKGKTRKLGIPTTVQKPPETGGQYKKRGHPRQYEKRLLAHGQKPYPVNDW